MVFWNHIASLKGEAIFYSFLGRRDEKNLNAYYNFWMNFFWSCAKSKFANGFYMIIQKNQGSDWWFQYPSGMDHTTWYVFTEVKGPYEFTTVPWCFW